jgi:hypothetical protein
MKTPLLIVFVTVTHLLNAQSTLVKRKLEVAVGKSTHGTGDIKGVSFATEYSERFKKRLNWTVGIGGTIHDGANPLFYDFPSGHTVDASIRYTTAGGQLTGDLGYSFIRTNNHDLKFRLGALARYQSSSYYDGAGIYYPGSGAGFPFPVVAF